MPESFDEEIVKMTTNLRCRDGKTGLPIPHGLPSVRGCPAGCKCDHYCVLRSETKFHLEHDKKIQDLAWKRTSSAELQFCGLALYLNANGTYSIEDTTGG